MEETITTIAVLAAYACVATAATVAFLAIRVALEERKSRRKEKVHTLRQIKSAWTKDNMVINR